MTGQCEPFPDYADCHRDQSFCGMWRSVAFLMSFAVLLELATLVAYIIIILGGQQIRHYGWKVVVSLLAAIVLVQCSGMAIIVCWDIGLPLYTLTEPGLPLRPRRTLLPRLATRYLMDPLHRVLDCSPGHRSRHMHGRLCSAWRRRLRTNSWWELTFLYITRAGNIKWLYEYSG